jgi:iron complex outermembrane receptor protein
MRVKNFSKRIKRIPLFILMGVFNILMVNAQISLSGIVTDIHNDPIPGASVIIKGTSTGVITDIDGHFSINAPENSTLIVSFLGFLTTEITVGQQRTLQIRLEEDNQLLDEIIVIGYGQVRRGDVTGSMTTIRPDELNRGMQITAQDALIGRVAGVNIVPGNGAPGSTGTIRIRMGASLSASNDPLIVIDGIPTANSASLSSINPNDIESFTVLKDASATAIFGSRASNGVIIITTKRGSSTASKPRINYSSNFAVSQLPGYYEVLSADEFRRVFAEHANAPESFQLGTASTDWQREIYRTGTGTEHNLSVTGNTNNIPYRASVGFIGQNGTLKKNDYQRYSGDIALSPRFLNNHLAFDLNVRGSIEQRNPARGVTSSATFFDPTRPIRQTNPDDMGLGYFMWFNAGGTPINLAASNPVADLELIKNFETLHRSIGNFSVDYKIHGLEDLSVKISTAYDVSNRRRDESIPDKAPSTYTSIRNDGRGRKYWSENRNQNTLFNSVITYNTSIDNKHNINAMGGYEWQRFWYENRSETIIKDVEDNTLPDEGHLFLVSFFGRFNYSFDHKFLVTATLRSDATSRFSPENRWGLFPSAAVAYRISEEDFLRSSNILSDLKLRLSYGQTGQQAIGGYYPWLGTYSISTDDVQYGFGNDWVNMFRPDGYNPNIKWETTSTYNVGIDYGFWNNRFAGSIDVFKRFTKDLLNEIDLPAGSNFTNRLATNIGSMESNGIELGLNLVPVNTRDWQWTVNGNFTYSKSKITKLDVVGREDNHVNAGGVDRNNLQIHKVGEMPNTFFLLEQAYDDAGKPMEGQYIAPDGSITTVASDANKYVTGKSSRIPYYYGLSTSLRYKQFDFGINARGAFDFYVFNYRESGQVLDGLFSGNGNSSNISKRGAERGFRYSQRFSDMFLEKGDFFTIDNVTLGYTFPRVWNNSSSLRLAFSAQNILKVTGYTGLDPEIFNGIDNSITYQRPRIYTLSVNLNF